MKNISGRYLSNVSETFNNTVGIEEVFVNSLMGNIISLEFTLFDKILKLTGVISKEEDLIQIYIMEKYTEKFHIHGFNLSGFSKTGVHGYINFENQKLLLHMMLNEYNKKPVEILFEGFIPSGESSGKKETDFNFFLAI